MNIDRLSYNLNLVLTTKNSSHPYFKEIQKIYQCPGSKAFEYLKLFDNLVLGFQYTFVGNDDVFVLRAPGRVNLIGEHLDYNGFSVLPIAIEKNIIFVFSKSSEPIVRVLNYDKDFSYREFNISDETQPFAMGDWGNYLKAGTIGLNYPVEGKINGFNALVYGDIPFASGLSSSSALVVASALAFLKSNDINFNKQELADKLSKAEHYVGTMGGGMDQAISMLGEEEKALKIDFFPLRTQSVKIPAGYSFVVANSCIKAPKTETARLNYNQRPIECKIAAAILQKEINEKLNKMFEINRLGDIKKIDLGINEIEIKRIFENLFIKGSYSIKQIMETLDLTEQEVKDKFLVMKDGSYFPQPTDGFKLKQRFEFVMSENDRVEKTIEALKNSDMNLLGKLMTEAHYGAKNLYEISCTELDKLVEILLESGSLGSRLTGAGFGGCTISLVKTEQVENFINKVKNAYYNEYLKKHNRDAFDTITKLDDCIFVANPCRGSSFLFES